MKSLLINLIVLLLFSFNLFAANSKDVALILKARGDSKFLGYSKKQWKDAAKGLHMDSGDRIRTGVKSFVATMFTDDKSLLKIREKSDVLILGERNHKTIQKKLQMSVGDIWIKVIKQKVDFLIETPTGVAAVKGTEFECKVDEVGSTKIQVFEGIVQLKNKFGEVLIEPGEEGVATATSIKKVKNPEFDKEIEEGSENKIELEFEDSNGKKVLEINYKEKE